MKKNNYKKFVNRYLYLFAILLAFGHTCYAQTKFKVTGTIVDNKGVTLPGVSVTEKGTSNVVVTDVKGYYTINIISGNGTLVFRYIGFDSQEVPVNKRTNIKISLKELINNLNEVVVVGYGQVKRGDLTGSVGSVKVEELQKAPVRSFEEALAGRIAGVQVSSNDGQPGAAYNINIRGTNSLTQDNSPLYVIDGFPIEGANNNNINPADIESIDVLKDASATAIYGARGANGVIIITTKRGKSGVPVVSFDAFYGVNGTTKQQALLSPYEFVRLMKETFSAYTDTTYLKNTTLDAYKNVSGINWQDEVLRNAPFQNYNVAVRGGSNGSNYSISLNALNQQGVVIGSGFRRYQGRLVMDQKVNDKLKVGVNMNFAYSKSYGLVISNFGGNDRANSFLASVWGYRPLAGSIADPLFDDANTALINSDLDNGVATTDVRYNPVSTASNTLNDRFTNAIFANGYLEYKFSPSLTLKISAGINRSIDKTNVFYNSHTRQGDVTVGGTGPYGSVDNLETNNYLNENTLNYRKTFNKFHQVDILAGATVQEQDQTRNGFTSSSLPNENLGISGLDEGIPTTVRSGFTNNTLISFLGRANYNYRSTYYLTATYRADGSSKFAPENHWSYFPSGAISWRLSNENFMKKIPVISDAKLRASYGITGNNRVSDFPYLSTITLPVANNYSFNSSYVSGANLASLGNKDLKWETTAQVDLGTDIEFYKGRIALTVDYYNKKTSNLLLNAALPGSTGYTSAFANIGKVQNSGWEFTLNTVNVKTKNFTWGTNFNISFNKSKVLELVDGQESLLSAVAWSKNGYGTAPAYIAKIGQPIALMYGYVFDGLYQYTDFNRTSIGTYVLKDGVPNNGSARSAIQPGYVKYKDLNGDGVVDSKDQTIIGNATPIHTGGFSNNFSYKNFDLNVFFQWSVGNQIINANRYVFESEVASNRNMFASFANRWTPDNQDTDIPVVRGNGPIVYSSRVIENGSYLRLKTAQLGYRLPDKWMKKVSIKSFRLYVSAQNLVTWTSYSGLDPEVSAYQTALTPGFDYSAYPRARTVTVGLNMTL
jgi:TonB-linked SusC/RagA family outer membrane protein